MIPTRDLISSVLLLLAVAAAVPCASAWTLQGWSGPSSGKVLIPGDPVSGGFTLHFDSWETGSTFEKDNSLTLYSDLSNASWTATMIETVNDNDKIRTELISRKAPQVRLDGWRLTFSRKQFDVAVALTGTVPATEASKNIVVLKVQELDENAKPVSGGMIKKENPVFIATTEPTTVPTTEEVAELVITPDETQTPVTTAAPARKQTYSPGPDPVFVCVMLGGLVLAAGLATRRTR